MKQCAALGWASFLGRRRWRERLQRARSCSDDTLRWLQRSHTVLSLTGKPFMMRCNVPRDRPRLAGVESLVQIALGTEGGKLSRIDHSFCRDLPASLSSNTLEERVRVR